MIGFLRLNLLKYYDVFYVKYYKINVFFFLSLRYDIKICLRILCLFYFNYGSEGWLKDIIY